LKCRPQYSFTHPQAVAIEVCIAESSDGSVIDSRSFISSSPTYQTWDTAIGSTRQVPGWTSLTTPVPVHL
jgi:hypothetical protein